MAADRLRFQEKLPIGSHPAASTDPADRSKIATLWINLVAIVATIISSNL